MIRVVAVATPVFALPTLDALHAAEDVVLAAVVTNADRPKGRGLKTASSPVKVWAAEKGLPVHATDELTDDGARGKTVLAPYLPMDALAVVASSLFIPKWIREPNADYARWGAVNLHPSLLPALRGPAPVNWAIMNGEAETGVTTIALSKEMDAGDVLMQEKLPIEPRDDAGTLGLRLAARGAALVLATLRRLRDGTVTPAPQQGEISLAPKITTATQQVNWANPNVNIDRLIRGLFPETPAQTTYDGEPIQILEAEPADGEAPPGRVLAADAEGIIVACGKGGLRLLRVKPAGRKEMSAHAFALGRRISPGALLG